MKELIIYLITFIFVYLFYIIFVYRNKTVFKKFPEGKEMKYLKYKYNIKVNDKNINKIAKSVFLANSFILSTTVYVMCFFDNIFIEIIVGLATLTLLILVMYYILGMCYKKEK